MPEMELPSHFQLKVAGGKTTEIPAVGYGTWAAGDPSWCKDAVLAALKFGYRHLDCAWMYGCDLEVGAAIRASGIAREKVRWSTIGYNRPEEASFIEVSTFCLYEYENKETHRLHRTP